MYYSATKKCKMWFAFTLKNISEDNPKTYWNIYERFSETAILHRSRIFHLLLLPVDLPSILQFTWFKLLLDPYNLPADLNDQFY